MSRPWYDRTPKRLIIPLRVTQRIARWCIRRRETIATVAIGACVAVIVYLVAAGMAAEWLG